MAVIGETTGAVVSITKSGIVNVLEALPAASVTVIVFPV